LGSKATFCEEDDYAIITRSDLELHFVLHAALVPAESFAGCYLRVADVESLYKAFLEAGLPRRGIPRMDAIEDRNEYQMPTWQNLRLWIVGRSKAEQTHPRL
jgi:hypothetical protein